MKNKYATIISLAFVLVLAVNLWNWRTSDAIAAKHKLPESSSIKIQSDKYNPAINCLFDQLSPAMLKKSLDAIEVNNGKLEVLYDEEAIKESIYPIAKKCYDQNLGGGTIYANMAIRGKGPDPSKPAPGDSGQQQIIYTDGLFNNTKDANDAAAKLNAALSAALSISAKSDFPNKIKDGINANQTLAPIVSLRLGKALAEFSALLSQVKAIPDKQLPNRLIVTGPDLGDDVKNAVRSIAYSISGKFRRRT